MLLTKNESPEPSQTNNSNHGGNKNKHIRASDLLPNYRPMGKPHVAGLWEGYDSLAYKNSPDYVSLTNYLID